MRKTNVAFIIFVLGTNFRIFIVLTNQDQVRISLKNSLNISQSCFSSFALYMIKISYGRYQFWTKCFFYQLTLVKSGRRP